MFNSLEGARGANPSDERVNDGVNNGGNVVDTTINVERVKELQGMIQVRWIDKDWKEFCGKIRQIFQ